MVSEMRCQKQVLFLREIEQELVIACMKGMKEKEASQVTVRYSKFL